MHPFNHKITRATRHLALMLLASFLLVSCGKGGIGSTPATPSIVTGVVKSGVVVIPPAEYNQVGAVTAATGGGLNITSSGSASTNLKLGDIVYLPPSATSGLTMPFAGRVVSTTAAGGAVTTQVTPVGVEDIYETLSWDIDTARSGAAIAGVIAQPNANVKFSSTPVIASQTGVVVTDTLKYSNSQLSGTVDVNQAITLPTGKIITIFATVDLSGVSVASTASYDLKKFASTNGWANASAIIRGTVSGKVGVKGEGVIPSLGDLIVNAGVFNDLNHQAGKIFSIDGLNNNDKKGRFPLGGVILVPYAATTFTGNIPDSALVLLAQAPSIVLWLYVDASGKISISGEIGKRFTESTFEQGYKLNAVGGIVQATKVSNSSIKGIEWYGNGSFDMTQRLGLSAAADVFIGGIRPLNVNTFIGAEYTGKLTGEGVLAEYPTTNLTGNVCVQNNMWAGQELEFNFRVKGTANLDVLFTTVQYNGIAEARLSDKVFTWIGRDGVGVDYASKCVASGPFGITATLVGNDKTTLGNALVDLDFTAAFTNPSIKPLANTWTAIARCIGCIDTPFDLTTSTTGKQQISLPVGNTYTIELQANSINYGLIQSAITSINIPAAPGLSFMVTSVDSSCTTLDLTAFATPFNGATIAGYTWLVKRTGAAAQVIDTIMPISRITLPSCGSTIFTVTAADSNGLSSIASLTLDTTQLVPAVTTLSASPNSGVQGSALTFTADGLRLQPGYDLSMTGCTATELVSTSATQRQYTCVPAQTGTFTATLKTSSTGTVLATTNVTINAPPPPPVVASTLNDTGITASQCYQAGSDILVACDSAGALALNPAQDGMVGRDANAATNSAADGKLGFSFTAVPAAGVDPGGCVQDNVTGLVWEVKTADGGLRDWNKTYTNYDSTTSAQKFNYTTFVSSNPTQAEIDAPTNSVGFKNSVNAQGLCGFSDWRLPTADELQSIVDYGVAVGVAFPGLTIESIWPNNMCCAAIDFGLFWSASRYVVDAGAWSVSFYNTFVNGMLLGGHHNAYGASFHVRLVRAGQPPVLPRYTVSADGQEVTDNQTRLIWQRCAEGMNWDGTSCTGAALTFTHEAALQRATAQAASTAIAWRLPNIKELSSIIDRSRVNPAIDPAAFPATPANWFWSASPLVGNSFDTWGVGFDNGGVHGGFNRFSSSHVRLVRAAP